MRSGAKFSSVNFVLFDDKPWFLLGIQEILEWDADPNRSEFSDER